MNSIKPTGLLLAILISATAVAQEQLKSVLDNSVQGGQKETSQCTDCCGAILNSEYLAQMQLYFQINMDLDLSQLLKLKL